MPSPGGRPRTVSPPPEDMIKLGEEMIEWVIVNDPIHLSKWYCIEKGFTDRQWDAMVQMPEFLPYYEAAMKMVGYKYIERDNELEPSLKHRWLRVYFKDLKRQEDADKDADAARSKDNTSTVDPNTEILVNALLKQISELQKNNHTTT